MRLDVDITHTEIARELVKIAGPYSPYSDAIYGLAVRDGEVLQYFIYTFQEEDGFVILDVADYFEGRIVGRRFPVKIKKKYMDKFFKELEKETGINRRKLYRGLNQALVNCTKYQIILSLNIQPHPFLHTIPSLN